MKIAIIGSGISGLTAAYYLKPHADITVFEKASRLGGHTATVDVNIKGSTYPIDTGFIVYNERTYPNFIRLLDELGVKTKKTDMGFSVSAAVNGLEYSGAGLNGLFAQRKNIINPNHWKMIFDILRFNKEAPLHIKNNTIDQDMTLGSYLNQYHYSDAFRDYYLIPMGAAIWSASTDAMLQFPIQFFIQFFNNHGLLQVLNRPQWYVIDGGSNQYIAPLTDSFKNDIRLNSDIRQITRHVNHVVIEMANGTSETYDHIVLACHSDEAISLLSDPCPLEKEIVGSIPYQNNEVVLHYDEALLPRNKLTWSSWNYLLHSTKQDKATLTYNMNILQGIKAPVTFCVTLNDTNRINKDKIMAQFNYAHPVFNQHVMQSQRRWNEVNGIKNTWFAGAYWRNGFHEDGVFSGIKAANGLLSLLGKQTINLLDY